MEKKLIFTRTLKLASISFSKDEIELISGELNYLKLRIGSYLWIFKQQLIDILSEIKNNE